jgi:hypothetical protein
MLNLFQHTMEGIILKRIDSETSSENDCKIWIVKDSFFISVRLIF